MKQMNLRTVKQDIIRQEKTSQERLTGLRRDFNTRLRQEALRTALHAGGTKTERRSVGANARMARDTSDHDTYYSSQELSAFVKRLASRWQSGMVKVIDPCAGRKQLTPSRAVATDIQPAIKGVRKLDFLNSSLGDFGVKKQGPIMFVMNPPFKIGKQDGCNMFLNKAGDLCEGRNRSIVVCVCYASRSVDIGKCDKVHRHLHLKEEHWFHKTSPMHSFERLDGRKTVVPIVVQVWRWMQKKRRLSPLYRYVPPATVPFRLDTTGDPRSTYYIRRWSSPARVGEILKRERPWPRLTATN